MRALQAEVTTTVITKHLPGLGQLADLARDLSTADGGLDPSARTRLEALPQTWTPIRTDDHVTELGDRMHRLRQATFDMAGPALHRARPGAQLDAWMRTVRRSRPTRAPTGR